MVLKYIKIYKFNYKYVKQICKIINEIKIKLKLKDISSKN